MNVAVPGYPADGHAACSTSSPPQPEITVVSLGVPGRLVDVLEGDVHLARADVSGVLRTIGVGVLGDAHLVPGDWVLIHAGIARSKINEDEAGRVRACLQLLDRPCAGRRGEGRLAA